MKKSMYKVFTICFQHGDAKQIDISLPTLASSHRANSRPDFRHRFLCASSRSRRKLYSRASFDVSCRHALLASENHEIGSTPLALFLSSTVASTKPAPRERGRLDPSPRQAFSHGFHRIESGGVAACFLCARTSPTSPKLAGPSLAGLRWLAAASAFPSPSVRALRRVGGGQSHGRHGHLLCTRSLECAL